VVGALMEALKPGVRGVFNVVGPDAVPLSCLLSEIGRPVARVPAPLLEAAIGLLFRLRVTSFPPHEVDHLRYLCMVDGARFEHEVGFKARKSLRDIIRQFAEFVPRG
jgi:UDP-glucose 4-epimerase